MNDHAATKPITGALNELFSDVVSSTVLRIANYRSYRRTLSELSRLSNSELDDLGLNRQDIRRVAIEGTYGN